MIRRRAAAVLAALALLSACATPRLGPAEGALSGRLALKVDAHAGNAARSLSTQFELKGDAERGELQLTSPLGSLLAQARWRPGDAELTTSDGTTRFADLDALAQQMLGEALPMAALIDWLNGRPWPGAPSQAKGAEAGFEQLGWSVSLARFGEGWVVAERAEAPAVSVRARIDR